MCIRLTIFYNKMKNILQEQTVNITIKFQVDYK